MNELWLTQQLRPYGVKTQNIRIDGVQAKGLLESDMMEVFRRYLPKGDVERFMVEAGMQIPTEETGNKISTGGNGG